MSFVRKELDLSKEERERDRVFLFTETIFASRGRYFDISNPQFVWMSFYSSPPIGELGLEKGFEILFITKIELRNLKLQYYLCLHYVCWFN